MSFEEKLFLFMILFADKKWDGARRMRHGTQFLINLRDPAR